MEDILVFLRLYKTAGTCIVQSAIIHCFVRLVDAFLMEHAVEVVGSDELSLVSFLGLGEGLEAALARIVYQRFAFNIFIVRSLQMSPVSFRREHVLVVNELFRRAVFV